MLQSDSAIKKKEDDILGRDKFAERIAYQIDDWKGEDSLVIGLNGSWGDGKTSIINLTLQALKRIEVENPPVIVEFNPWINSSVSEISTYFFNELSANLKVDTRFKNNKELLKRLKKYSRYLNLFTSNEADKTKKFLIPFTLTLTGLSLTELSQLIFTNHLVAGIVFVVTFVLVGGVFAIKKVIEFLQIKTESNIDEEEISLLKLKEKIIALLKKEEIKLLVVIDDIDRLSPKQIKALFTLIKSNADFPHSIYLLAFDRTVVERQFTKLFEAKRNFLEKIVQINYDIPKPPSSKISEILESTIQDFFNQLPNSHNELFNREYWAKIYFHGFRSFFKNLRDIKRYSNSLEFNRSFMFQEKSMEVNPIDFIALEALRVFAPSYYNFIRNNKHVFTKSHSKELLEYHSDEEEDKIRKERYEKGLALIENDEIKNSAHHLTQQLFPVIKELCNNYYTNEITGSRYLKISEEDKFDTYFTLLPGVEEDISQFDVDKFLDVNNSIDQLTNLLKGLIERDKFRELLVRINDYSKNTTKIPVENEIKIIVALFNVSDDLPAMRKGLFNIPPELIMRFTINNLLSRNLNYERNFQILKEAISNTISVNGPMQQIFNESCTEEVRENKDPNRKYLIQEEHLPELQKLCVSNILKKISSNSIWGVNDFHGVMDTFKKWDNSEYTKFIKGINDTDEKFILFVK